MSDFYVNVANMYLRYDYDADVDYFSKAWAFPYVFRDGSTPPKFKIMEVGANEEPLANIFALEGYDVTGVDWRDYIPDKRKFVNLPLNFNFVKADFNSLTFNEEFDMVFSLSTIEHFGLDAYGAPVSDDADIFAMHNIWYSLKRGGLAYITVPVGVSVIYAHEVNGKIVRDTRVYSAESLFNRIITYFYVEKMQFFCSAPVEGYSIGSEITSEVAFRQPNENATVLLVLRKG
jgi:hypothetical protein